MAQHLMLRLRAPLIAFGGETIDNLGVIRDFPALSMLTGLLANALGWDRGDDAEHNRLQQRLRMGTRLNHSGQRLQDYQTARLLQTDKGWTTLGQPEGREPSPSYKPDRDGQLSLTLQRYRDYHADMDVLLVFRLEPADEFPRLADLAQALDKPARPLFVGRKACLPCERLLAGWVEADHLLSALETCAPVEVPTRVQWPLGEGTQAHARPVDVCDERNWTSGVHGGWRPVLEGLLQPAREKDAA